MARRRLGEILIDHGLIDEAQLRSALGHQRRWGGRLGDVLVNRGFVGEGALVEALGRALDLPVVDLDRLTPDTIALDHVGVGVCEAHDVLPLRMESGAPRGILTAAVADPQDLAVLEALEFQSGCRVRPVLATPSSIRRGIARWYRGQVEAKQEERLHVDGPRAAGPQEDEMVLIRRGGEEQRVRSLPLPPRSQAHAPPKTPAPRVAPAGGPRLDREARLRRLEADVDFLLGRGAEPLPHPAGPVLGLARLLIDRGLVTPEELATALQASAPERAA